MVSEPGGALRPSWARSSFTDQETEAWEVKWRMQSSVLVSGSLHESGVLRGFLMKTGKGRGKDLYFCFAFSHGL